MLKNMRGIVWVALIVFGAVLQPQDSDARLIGTHADPIICGDCHGGGGGFTGMFSETPSCLNNAAECHNVKQFAVADASKLFNYSSISASKGTSHAWGVPYVNISAGSSTPGIRQSQYGPGSLGCSSCHYPHYLLPGSNASEPLLKLDNTSDALCLNCHRSRNVDNASTLQPGKQMSHPVGKTLPATSAYRTAPRDTYDNITGSKLKLVGPSSDKVSCSTCHGVHYADSNPWTATYDVLSGTTDGKGVLLRRYNDSELCKDCHTYMGHSGAGQQTCRNCHDPHLGKGKNFRLIYPNLSTPAYGIVTTVFDNLTTQLAGRSDGKRGVCDACHILVGPSKYFTDWSSIHEGQNPKITSATMSTTNCFGCHEHAIGATEDWTSFGAGGAAACSLCHGYPPTKNVFGGPSGFAQFSSAAAGWYNYADDSAYQPEVDESTSPHKRHAIDYPYDQGSGYPDTTGSCYACHAEQDHPKTGTLTEDFQNVVFGLYSRTSLPDGGYDPVARTCGAIYCHSKPTHDDTVANANVAAFDWDFQPGDLAAAASGGNICNACHDAVPITNRHEMHTDGVDYSFACRNCHDRTVSDNSTIKDESAGYHVNRKKDVFFAATAVSGSYSNDSAKECSDTYCHGLLADNQGLNATPNFDEAGGSAPCGSCHALPPSGDHATHDIHVTDYSFECAYCHFLSMDWDEINTMDVKSKATHVDFEETVEFGNDGQGRTNAGGGYDNAIRYCDTIYCHSAGTTPLSGDMFVNQSAIWTAVIVCNSCHGEYPAVLGGWTSAMPDYADESVLTQGGNPKANSHRQHVVDNGIDCVTCHELTVFPNNSTIIFTNGTSHHVDGNYDIKINSAYDAGGAEYIYDATGGTCDNVTCHGGLLSSVKWGDDNITCSSCHNTSGADVDDFVYSNFSGTVALINFNQYSTSGHGRLTASTYPSNSNPADDNDGANITCNSCHNSGESHGNASNPFRLWSSNPDQLCNICHGLDALGTAVNKGIFNHSSTTTDALVVPDGGRYRFELKCVDCHDPHGDDNAFMIHSTLPRVSDQTPAYEVSDQYGTPNPGITEWRNVDFPNNGPEFLAYTSDSQAQNRICNVCHSRTNDVDGTGTRKRYTFDMTSSAGQGVESHKVGNQCTSSCHKHTVGFEGVSCAGCHGMPPVAGNMLIDNGAYSASPTGEGAHAKHGEIYISGARCNVCHDKSSGGMDNSGNLNTTLDINFKGDSAMLPYTTGSYDGEPGRVNPPYNGSFTELGSYACSKVKCHGSALVDGKGFDITPVWDDLATGDCGACHGAKKSAGTPFTNASAYPGSGAHAKHAGFAAGQYDILCKTCHDATLATTTTVVDSVHVNAKSKVQLDITSNKIDTTGGYTDEAIGTPYMNCDNTYCHSMGNITTSGDFNLSPPNDNNLTWEETRACSSCHGNLTYSGYTAAMPNYPNGTPKANTHKMHVVDRNIACNVCHGATTADNTSIAAGGTSIHVDKNYQVALAASYDNEGAPDFTYNVVTKSCTGTDCHGGNFANWSSTAGVIICEDCHVSLTADDDDWNFSNWSGTVAKIKFSEWTSIGHGNSGGANLGCGDCHDASKGHSDGATYFRLMSTNSPDQLCLYCHGSGAALKSSWTLSNKTGIQSHTYDNMSTAGYKGGVNGWSAGWSTFTPKCIDCHDPHGDNNTAMTHSYINISGSTTVDPKGRPIGNTTRLVNFTSNTVGSYVTNLNPVLEQGVCQVCHIQANFYNKTTNTGHNIDKVCTDCHKHGDAFYPSGCDGCHSYPPPAGPTTPRFWNESSTDAAVAGLHTPHAFNGTTGMPNGNAIDGGKGYMCESCHQNNPGSGGDHETGKANANMTNMTTGTWDAGAFSGITSVTDDTCADVRCHSPRGYTRTWAKPTDCDDCHGGRNIDGYTNITSGTHKLHTYSSTGEFNYKFDCTRCHVNNMSNYSTHYDSQVSMAAITYTKGSAFEPSTSTSEYSTCTTVYCHGQFTGGGPSGNGTAGVPVWGTPLAGCDDCHMEKTQAATMPGKHPRHVATSPTGYDFECQQCHVQTVSGNTTLQYTNGTHANFTTNVDFDTYLNNNDGTGWNNGSGEKQCLQTYCHSNGTDVTVGGPYPLGNYTADWDGAVPGCNYCHGNETYGGVTSAMPLYPNGAKFNSHSTHVLIEGIFCKVCHDVTLAADGTILTPAAHVNRAYDIDIMSAYDGNDVASNWTAASSTCNGIKCHGDGTPTWDKSVTVDCSSCHETSGADVDDFAFGFYTGTIAKINDADWASKGHGRTSGQYAFSNNTAAVLGCAACHNPAIAHNTGTNPFRLYSSDPDELCNTCHGPNPATPAKKTGVFTHHSAVVNNGNKDFALKCVDCHDPHGDNDNIFMIHDKVALPEVGNSYTPSDQYGTPLGNYTNVDFVSNAAGEYASGSLDDLDNLSKVCNTCHSRTFDPGETDERYQRNMAGAPANDDHQNGAKCTSCHKHIDGFMGEFGPSPGNQPCKTCHGDLFKSMTAVNSYHHYMVNDDAVYSNSTALTTSDGNRRCMMCHADHDIFNDGASRMRKAFNLREAAYDNVTAGINTDFYPAKDTGKYADTYPVSGNPAYNGVCISCHNTSQDKNQSNRGNGDLSQKARGLDKFVYYSSSHNYQILSSMNNWSEDGTSFRSNCSKCHRTNNIDKPSAQTTSFKASLHDTAQQSVLNADGTAAAPDISSMCYKCHDDAARAGGGPGATHDMYSSVAMKSSAKTIKTAIVAKKSGHPIDNAAMSGKHDPAEFNNMSTNVTSSTWNAGNTRHVECTDCHNTHGGNAGIKRYPGGPYSGYTGSEGAWTHPAGSKVAGSQKGAWGVSFTYGGGMGASPTFTLEPEVEFQYELCIKCHSSYAYGDSPEPVPSQLPDPSGTMTSATPYETFVADIAPPDVAKMINPNNYGYHPVYATGKNQPPSDITGNNWPAAKPDWMYVNQYTNVTSFINVSGLSWNFVPPWNTQSLMSCSDCHQADNTGQAVARLLPVTDPPTILSGTWANLTTVDLVNMWEDGKAATDSNALASFESDVSLGGSPPGADATEAWVVVYASTNAGSKNAKKLTLSGYDGATWQDVVVSYGANIGRGEGQLTFLNLTSWTALENSYKVKVTANATAATVAVDYIGLEAIYPAPGDLRGPHGSLEKWILQDLNPNVNFDADRNGSLADAGDKPNTGVTDVWLKKTFCWNCHRSDVYNAGGTYETYSRFSHGDEARIWATARINVWGIVCMNCHGGGGPGEIHGSFSNSTTYWPGASNVNLNRPKGVRLMNGAVFNINVDPSSPSNNSCYTISGTSTAYYETTACASGQHEPGSEAAGAADINYDYGRTSW